MKLYLRVLCLCIIIYIIGPKWTSWICGLLGNSSTRILVNGVPGRPIFNYKGFRQGEPQFLKKKKKVGRAPVADAILVDHRTIAKVVRVSNDTWAAITSGKKWDEAKGFNVC